MGRGQDQLLALRTSLAAPEAGELGVKELGKFLPCRLSRAGVHDLDGDLVLVGVVRDEVTFTTGSAGAAGSGVAA